MTPQVKNEDRLTNFGHFCNGAGSMTTALIITQPATTYKTFSQANKNIDFYSSKNSKGLIPIIRTLWAGFIPNAVSGATAESVAFLTYSYGKQKLQNEAGELSTGHNFILSSVSGLLGSPANSILEQLMIRQQLYKGDLLSHFITIYKTNGLTKGVFKGSCVTAGRDMGFNTGVFALTDTAKKILKPYIADQLTWEFASGLLAGGVAGFLSNPWDRAKTMMQSDLEGKYKTFRSTVQIILKEEGFVGLYRGGTARTITISLLVCFTSMLKERVPMLFPNSLKIRDQN